jgi:hypothetical protein
VFQQRADQRDDPLRQQAETSIFATQETEDERVFRKSGAPTKN